MRVPRAASRSANLCLLLLLLLHLSGTLARSSWGHNRGAGQRRGGGHQGRRNMGRHRRKDQLIHPTAAEIPYFDPASPTHIKAQMGSNAYLPCKIKNLGNKSVSWVRNKDAHILSVDRYTFIQDARFATWHEAVTNTWTLQVKYVKAADAGRYECQVSTEPKMSHFVHLNVITPSVTIPGGSELHVRSGSTVTIKCVVSQALHPPSYVFWYHGEQRIPEGKWKGVTQEPLSRRESGGSEAALTISSVNHAHAGNYTCSPAALTPISVILHVLNELPVTSREQEYKNNKNTQHNHTAQRTHNKEKSKKETKKKKKGLKRTTHKTCMNSDTKLSWKQTKRTGSVVDKRITSPTSLTDSPAFTIAKQINKIIPRAIYDERSLKTGKKHQIN